MLHRSGILVANRYVTRTLRSMLLTDFRSKLWMVGKMTPEQCRAARAWLDISQHDLAAAANVSVSTIRDFEAGKRKPIPATLSSMEGYFNNKGMQFVTGADQEPIAITFDASQHGTHQTMRGSY